MAKAMPGIPLWKIGKGGLSMGRFIKLATPEVCGKCHKLIRAGRVAYWHMATFRCYSCIRKSGEAIESAEEKALAWEIEGE